MKKVILAVLAVLVVSLSGCYETKNTTTNITNNYYGNPNSVLAEEDSMNDPNQYEYEIITLSFDSFNFGDSNRSLKRARQTQDLISFLANAQEKKVSYIEGCFYDLESYRQYEFRIEPNESTSIRLAVGNYFVEANAYCEMLERCFHLFSGERNITINKGVNDCPITMILYHFQPIIIDLPENGMINDGDSLRVDGERINGNSFTSYLYPLEANNNRLIGTIPIDLKLMTILYEGHAYNFGPEIFDAVILGEVLSLDDYKPEKATSAKVEFQLAGKKLIAGAQSVVMMISLEGVGDNNIINSIWLKLNGAENDIEKTIVTEGDIELGSSNVIENNIVKIDLSSSIEFVKEEKIVLVMEALVSPTAIGNQISFGLEAFIGSLTFKMNQVCPEFTIIDKGSMSVGYPRHYDPMSSHIILSESTENDVEYIEFEPIHEDVQLESFTINVKDGGYCGNVLGSYMDLISVSIYDGYMKVAEKDIHSPATTIEFSDLIIHQSGDSWGKMLTLKVNGAKIGNGGLGTPNADVKIVISNIKAHGLSSNKYVNIIEGNLESDLMILRKSLVWIKTPRSHEPLGAATNLVNGDNIIYVAEVHSEGGSSLMYKQYYGVNTSSGVSISDPYLMDQNGNIVSVGKLITEYPGSYFIVFYFNNPDFDSGLEKETIEIPGYSSRPFYLHALVSGAKKGSTLSCHIRGDYTTNYCSPMNVADEVEGYFVWSDNHLELSISNGDAINAKQWYNGDFIYSNYLYTISY